MSGVQVFIKRSAIAVPAQVLFDWHLRPGAFERLAPPWETVQILQRDEPLAEGSRVTLRMGLVGPISQTWVAEHRDIIPGVQFTDIQLSGPFSEWKHTHRIEPTGPTSCILEDRIEYRPPYGLLGLCGLPLIRRKLHRVFTYRHAVTAADVQAHYQASQECPSMKILVSGPTGLVGSALVAYLTSAGHQVTGLTRKRREGAAANFPQIEWNPATGALDSAALEGFDAVIHLAGDNIATSRWTVAKKQQMRDSRVLGTRLLAEKLSALQSPPQTVICASAIGYYGNRGNDLMTESSSAGTDYLSELCREWESAAEPLRARGIRTVHTRIGVVLSPRGGALHKMLTPFKLGVGGILGNGRQYMSWIALDDIPQAMLHVLQHPELQGPVNFVAPQPVTNYDFTKALGRVLRRPTIFPAPAFALRLALGQMADELLLSSTRVEPSALLHSGYTFRFPTVEPALRHLLGAT